MELPPRSGPICGPPRIVESNPLQAQFAGVLRLNSSFGAGAKEFLHASMPKAFDHFRIL
jgi:hypothetical protein